MGIDNFHKWTKSTYTSCFKKIGYGHKYDNMLIDMNHILHACIYSSSDKEDFKKKLYCHLDTLLSSFIITKNIIFGTDGPAPYSKLILQRKRRLAGIKGVDMNRLNSIHLTPGTEFMRYVDDITDQYISNIRDEFKFNKVNIISFGASIPDEGELKLFRYVINSEDSLKQSHLIIGNDADLIVMATSNRYLVNADILIKGENHSFELLSIGDLVTQFYKSTVPKDICLKNVFLSNSRDDFSCISLMMGNDYLPKLQNVTFDILFESYKKIKYINRKGLIIDGKFNKQFLLELMVNTIPNMAKHFRKFKISRYDKGTVKSYLQGLLWCLCMYQSGRCPKYDYMYEGLYKPNPHDVIHYIITNKRFNIKIPKSNIEPVSSKYYGIYVLPKAGLAVISKDIRDIAEKVLKDIHDIEECSECEDITSTISIKHKLMYELNKLKDKEMYVDERKALSNTLRDLNEQLIMHKKTAHNNREFCAKDVRRLSKLI